MLPMGPPSADDAQRVAVLPRSRFRFSGNLPITCIMEFWNALPGWFRQIAIALVCFTVGALGAFGYSYRPLHGALTFKVEALEQRIDQRNRENLALKDEVALLQSGESSCIQPEELEEVKRELGQIHFALGESQAEVERVERNLRDANANANRWRKRFHSIRDAAEPTLPAAPTPAPQASAPPAASPPAPASPATSNPAPLRPEPLFGAPLEDFSPPSEASPKPAERGILLPSDSEDPF